MPVKSKPAPRSAPWTVGFALADITPPLGTHLFGFGGRDRGPGCEAIHDPLQVRAVWIAVKNEPVLLLAYDVLFFDRAEADRIKGAVGRVLDLTPRQILINCSHTHIGPVTGTWAFANYEPLKNQAYLDDLVDASIRASVAARNTARPARLRFGKTRSTLPVSRRFLTTEGKAEWRPAPAIPIYDTLPVLSFDDPATNTPIALIFTVACHPSTAGGLQISADYPGVARELIDHAIGRPASVFLQGVGGDTKPCVVANGPADDTGQVSWRSGSWEDIHRAGELVADAVLKILPRLKAQPDPLVQTVLTEVELPLTKLPTPTELEQLRSTPEPIYALRRLWATRQLELLAARGALSPVAPILIQSIRLSESLRFVALEGEPVAAWGWAIEKAFRSAGTVIPLGYSNGQGLYLPVEANLVEGGYEVESAYEYGFSGQQLAPGFSKPIGATLKQLKQEGKHRAEART
jgi:neutral ceramidase